MMKIEIRSLCKMRQNFNLNRKRRSGRQIQNQNQKWNRVSPIATCTCSCVIQEIQEVYVIVALSYERTGSVELQISINASDLGNYIKISQFFHAETVNQRDCHNPSMSKFCRTSNSGQGHALWVIQVSPTSLIKLNHSWKKNSLETLNHITSQQPHYICTDFNLLTIDFENKPRKKEILQRAITLPKMQVTLQNYNMFCILVRV